MTGYCKLTICKKHLEKKGIITQIMPFFPRRGDSRFEEKECLALVNIEYLNNLMNKTRINYKGLINNSNYIVSFDGKFYKERTPFKNILTKVDKVLYG